MRGCMRVGRRRAGFTVIEILIAIVVLSVGLVGIMAVFPTAIQSGARTVEDTYAGIITQSVVDAIQVGLRENRSLFNQETLFLLQHPGTSEQLDFPKGRVPGWQNAPQVPSSAILLPQGGKIVIYPTVDEGKDPDNLPAEVETNLLEKGLMDNPHSAVNYSASGTPWQVTDQDDPTLFSHYFIGAAYPAAPELAKYQDTVRKTKQGNFTNMDRMVVADQFSQYSWAFKLKQAKVSDPSDTSAKPAKILAENLYEVTVYVFRNFRPGQRPLKEMTTMVSF